MKNSILIYMLALSACVIGSELPYAAAASEPDAISKAIKAYNSLPDSDAQLMIAGEEVGAPKNAIVVPHWTLTLALSRDEAASLVALEAAFDRIKNFDPAASMDHHHLPLAGLVAGAAAAALADDAAQKANPPKVPTFPENKTFSEYSISRRGSTVRPDERFMRLLSALGSCPAAFASLAVKLDHSFPDSALTAFAHEARSDRLELFAKPDASCNQE